MGRHPFLTRVIPRLTGLTDQVGAGGVLVALSGGPDSVALLLAARAWREDTGRPIAAAHLNHCLRGADADADALFCQELCARLDVPLRIRIHDVRVVVRARGRGLEEAARHARRQLFAEVLADNAGLACVATGHHRDDQVETVLMRLWRGCGLDGLRGIAPRSGRVIHPLLQETRPTILEFLAACDQPWRLDETNASGRATRNRVRRELLPLVRDIFGAGAAGAPARLAELAAQDTLLLEELTAEALAACRAGDPQALSVTAVTALSPALARRVLRRWLIEAAELSQDVTSTHIDAVRAWLARGQSGQGLDLPGGVRLERQFDRLLAAAEAAPALAPSGCAADFRVSIQPGPELPLEPASPTVGPDGGALVCPADVLSGNLRVANWRPGDRIQPFGLRGRKKLSDLFQEKHIVASRRASLLLVADAAGILWIPGVAQAERTRLLPTTRRAVTILLQRRATRAGAPNR